MTDQNMPGIAGRVVDLALDGAALAGAALITYGVDLIYRPAAFIVAGLFTLGGAWLSARTSA